MKTIGFAARAAGAVLLAAFLFSCSSSQSGLEPPEVEEREKTGLFPVQVGGKWGLINRQGELVLDAIYSEIGTFYDGVAPLKKDGAWGLVGRTGSIRIAPQFDELSGFSEGLAAVKVEGKWGFIDRAGSLVINPRFEGVAGFKNGRAAAQEDGQVGWIDKTGSFVVSPQFDDVSSYSGGLAAVLVGEKVGYVDLEGQYVINPRFEYDYSGAPRPFSQGLAAVKVDDQWGYVNAKGETVIMPQFSWAGTFHEGQAIVRVGSRYGIINKEGKYVVNPRYEAISILHDGLRAVQSGQKWGFVDASGAEVVAPQFDDVVFGRNPELMVWASWMSIVPSISSHGMPTHEGLAIVQVGEKHGMVDKKGQYVLNPQYDDISDFSEGLASVERGGSYGFVDASGKLVIEPQFDRVRPFSEGRAAVRSGNRWGYVDKKGELVVNPQFTRVEDFFDGLAYVWQGTKAGYIDQGGSFVWGPEEAFPPATTYSGALSEASPSTGGYYYGKYYQDYEVEVGEGVEGLGITLLADFDGYLEVVGPTGRRYTNDDWRGSLRISRVESPYPARGTWYIRVTSYASYRTGSFRLRISQGPLDAERDIEALRQESQAAESYAAAGVTTTPDGVATVRIRPVGEEMRYEETQFTVEAGQTVHLVFENTAISPAMHHNVVILADNSDATATRIGQAALAEADHIPEDGAILAYTEMAAPQETAVATFTAPNTPGDYRYICTYPGHYMVMQGTMRVVAPVSARALGEEHLGRVQDEARAIVAAALHRAGAA